MRAVNMCVPSINVGLGSRLLTATFLTSRGFRASVATLSGTIRSGQAGTKECAGADTDMITIRSVHMRLSLQCPDHLALFRKDAEFRKSRINVLRMLPVSSST